MEIHGTQNSQKQILKKKNKVGKLTHPNFKDNYKVTVIKTVRDWHKDRNIGQWNRTENPEINPHVYGQLIFNKNAKTIQWERNSLFNEWC